MGTIGGVHPVVFVKLRLKASCRENLRIVKTFYRYNDQYSVLILKEGGQEDIVEEWDKMRRGDKTYETVATLEAQGAKTVEEVIERFDQIGIQIVETGSIGFHSCYVKNPPEIIERYCVHEGFIEYD